MSLNGSAPVDGPSSSSGRQNFDRNNVENSATTVSDVGTNESLSELPLRETDFQDVSPGSQTPAAQMEVSELGNNTRVRFSEDVQRVLVKSLGSNKTATQSGPEVTTASGVKQQNTSSQPVRAQSRSRDRGYSLRRSLFAQNIQRQSTDHGMVMEMESDPSSFRRTEPLSSGNSNKGQKGPTVVTIEEAVDSETTFPTDPVRLSDPKIDLPLYSKWLKQQRSRPSIQQRGQKLLSHLQQRIFRVRETPSTPDGRHVQVNTDQKFSPIDQRTESPYVSNIIRSCRYTLWNFFPRQLVAQFGKLANFYFLCVSILQMIPGLSTTGTYTTIVPLLIFVSISMGKEGYDDIRRNRLDKEENERSASVLDSKCINSTDREAEASDSAQSGQPNLRMWRKEKWQDVRVGDVVLLQRDSPVPADLILLQSSENSGIAYVETKSLDGETNLKSKKPLDAISKRCSNEHAVSILDADFVVEDPNLDLYKFDGKTTVGGETFALTNNEVLYRGSVLRNTSSIMGLVIYSGEECKIRMNANKNPRVKAPTLQARVNRVVIIVASLVFLIAIVMTLAYQIWRRTTERTAWYLTDARVPFGHILTSFIIMFNTMLPLSLYVSLEIVKVAQMFMMNDIDMYDPETDIPMEARTSTINEELGQVSYIFSDKTGTLTNNSMRFRKMSIAGTAWLHDQDLQEEAAQDSTREKLRHKKRAAKGKGKSISKIKQSFSRKSVTSISRTQSEAGFPRPSGISTDWQDSVNPTSLGSCGKTEELLDYIHQRPNSIFARKARFFILALALCHTCVPEKDEDGTVTFQASSPDELALVMAAQDLGYVVTDRQGNTITVKTYPNGEDNDPLYEVYEILDVIEFSSARKRMSIIVRLPDSRICIICKGADSTIRQLLRLSELATAHSQDVERRASIRKSLEAQEVIRRRSSQVYRTSIGASPISTIVGRNSSISVSQPRTVRDSIDAWLRDRETGPEASGSRRGTVHKTPRGSTQVGPADIRSAHASVELSRLSLQDDGMNVMIDESIVINDNAIFERCFQHIDDFATEGLRTLLYGNRMLSEEEYQEWKAVYHAASTSLVNRQEKVELAGQLIEKQLDLLGATAIEDKLQDGVPDAIERFRRAGIKMWMLTGDKRETAINIGHSCQLIKDYSSVIVLDHELGELPSRMTAAVASVKSAHTAHSVLVIDGQTLTFIDTDPALKALLTDLAIAADSVICCRASPSQKAALVKTIRTEVKDSVTLAIGDGANDIAMIQEAHLGIGIAGKEGLQAARTSDYSIAQFRFLLKLLLVHGRWNYIRVCKYTLGTFWKEMIFYLVQALYQRWAGYTGTSLYEPWSLSMFNTLFTSLPVIFMGVFEKDLSASTLLAVPELYSVGRRNQGFNIPRYMSWAVLGACEAVIIYFIMYSIYGEAIFTRDNQLYAMGSLAFSACVVLISLKMQCFELHNKSLTAVLAMFLSIGGWWLWNLLLSVLYNSKSPIYNVNGGLVERFGRNPLWWLTLLLIIVAVSVLEITAKALKTSFLPSDTETFQAYERDIDVKKRFEESAADLLQQGWDRSTKRSSLEVARDAEVQARREAEVQEMLNRPRTMEAEPAALGMRKRQSWQPEMDGFTTPPQQRDGDGSARRSLEIGELFSKGYGLVKKGTMK